MPIDFHTHILPGIDDGSRNVEMSLRMLAAQREQQVDEIVATPHFYAQKDSVEEFLLRRQCSYEKLKTKMAETNLDQKLHLAAEVYYFQGIGSAGMIPKLCVEGTQTLLLEMPFAQWDSAIYADVEKLVRHQKLKVVLAHIERYYEFQKKKEIWNAVMELPVYRQMNAGVFLNWKKRHKAFSIVKEAGSIILGSDCHNTDTRRTNLAAGRVVLAKKIRREFSTGSGPSGGGGIAVNEKKKTMRAVIEIVIAVLVIIAVYFIIRGMDRHDAHIRQEVTEKETQHIWKEFQKKTVTIKLQKKIYRFAHPVQTYLFIGTDKSGNEDASGEEYRGSMADALMLVVVDEEEKAYGILQLNRDTITEVPMLLQDGSANASAQMQLCTAHWYGKDKAASCDNTVETVSKMLGGLPIDGYYALKMDAMPLLNHEVGGVTVTLEDDMTKLDPAMKKGATLTLTDRQAELLMQSRYAMDDDRNTQRMRRQQIFLNAFMKKIKKQNAGDVNATVKLYDRLRPYATTDIKMNDLTALLKDMQGYTDKGIITIDGTSKIGEKLHDGKKHWEFYMDEDSLETSMKQLYPLVQEKGK